MYDLERDFNKEFYIDSGTHETVSSDNMKLRYQVWCIENDYFPTSDFEDCKESDEYDRRSLYVVLANQARSINIATARVIVHDKFDAEAKFPIEKFVMLRRHDRDFYWDVPREQIGEISRFCVSKVYRRRAFESETTHGISPIDLSSRARGKRRCSYITLGLFKGLLEVSLEANLKFWYALMEPSLLRLLRGYGVNFTPIGPCVDYFGRRQPCMICIDSLLLEVRKNSQEIGDFVCPQPMMPLTAMPDYYFPEQR